jgi:hypothetical protein
VPISAYRLLRALAIGVGYERDANNSLVNGKSVSQVEGDNCVSQAPGDNCAAAAVGQLLTVAGSGASNMKPHAWSAVAIELLQ